MNNDLILEQLAIGPMQNFVYLIGSRSSREVVVVDPAWDIDGILERVAKLELTLTHALITHYHQDHVGGSLFGFEIPGIAQLLERLAVKIVCNKHEASGLKQVTGVSHSDLFQVDGGDMLRVGQQGITLLHTPGHTPGSQCFLIEDQLVSGDTLFIGSCGRVDLPGANAGQLYDSLTQVLMKLPDDTILYPGHSYGGDSSTMGLEKRTNQTLLIRSKDQWLRMMGQ